MFSNVSYTTFNIASLHLIFPLPYTLIYLFTVFFTSTPPFFSPHFASFHLLSYLLTFPSLPKCFLPFISHFLSFPTHLLITCHFPSSPTFLVLSLHYLSLPFLPSLTLIFFSILKLFHQSIFIFLLPLWTSINFIIFYLHISTTLSLCIFTTPASLHLFHPSLHIS